MLVGLLLPASYPDLGSGWQWEPAWDVAQRSPALVAFPFGVGVAFLLCGRLRAPARGRALAFAGIGFWIVQMTVLPFRDHSAWTTQRPVTSGVPAWLCAVVAGSTLFVANHFRRRYPTSREAHTLAAATATAAILALLALRVQPAPGGLPFRFSPPFTDAAVAQFAAAGLAAALTLASAFAKAGGAWQRVATSLVRGLGFALVFLGVPADAYGRFGHWLHWVRGFGQVPDAPLASVVADVALTALRGIGGALVLAVGIAAWMEPWIARRHRRRSGTGTQNDLEAVFG